MAGLANDTKRGGVLQRIASGPSRLSAIERPYLSGMGHTRTRFNAKARQSLRNTSKRKQPQIDVSVDPNAEILVPKTREEKDRDRKERLKQQLISESESKWNSKKKKRLEKYIDKKLKKEERVAIFEKLTITQAELPSTSTLQTSSTLGTGKSSTHQQRIEQLEDKEVRRILDGNSGSRKRHLDQYDYFSSSGSEDEQEDKSKEPSEAKPTSPVATAVGSALQRDPNGRVSSPTKRPKGSAIKSWTGLSTSASTSQRQADSDTSFDSSDSENDDGTQSSGSDSEEPEPTPKKRSLGFKQWAMNQLSAVKGYAETPQCASGSNEENAAIAPPAKKRKIEAKSKVSAEKHGPLGESYQLPSTSFTHQLSSVQKQNVKVVTVARPSEVQESRLLLPIVAEEQPIMEAILLNPVVIICGETGSGKTTQVPQFLYEAGFGTPGSDNPGMIGVTQPRRVAAMSMASRVAHELSLTSSKVSYQIRYDATVSPSTSIKFMTDGVLLRELATDFLLKKYSVIIIDEAHERSMNTDILIGVLSRVLKLREEMWKEGKDDMKPLRLIIMSATLRVSDFAENKSLFPSPPPVINVAARQHPVTVHFGRRTSSDYVNEAIRKTVKIHTRLPPGGILIFLTGQNEITGVYRRLEGIYGRKAVTERKKHRLNLVDATADLDDNTPPSHRVAPAQADVETEEMELGVTEQEEAFDLDEESEESDTDALGSEDEDEVMNEELGLHSTETDTYMHIVPLYSLLPSDKQMKVFEPPPPNSRLVVVSTNVAETSLTIPGIRYVVDCGRAKERRHDAASGIQSFQVAWISKASAAQRAGRAGRTGPGHCYRLYSSALFEHHFEQFTRPEILRTPIEGIVLQMKSMHIDVVTNFPFPTPPDREMLRKAETILTTLGALHPSTPITGALSTGGHITTLGRSMALFPLPPRFSRMLVSGQQQGCLPYVIAIVASLAVGDPFIHEEGLANDVGDVPHVDDTVPVSEAQRARRKAYFQTQATHASLGKSTSDIFKVLSVVGAYEYAGGGHEFCEGHFVRPKMMEEIHKLRAQISNIVEASFPGTCAMFTPKLSPPSNLQLKSLRQLLTAAFIDQVAVRKDLVDRNSAAGVQYSTAKGVPYRALGIEEDVFIHPSSVVTSISPPEYVIYTEIVRTSRAWLKGITIVNPVWLASLGKSLCSFSKPTTDSKGLLVTVPFFGQHRWELPPIKYKPELS